MAVVLPVPAAAIPNCTRAPLVAIPCTSAAWPAFNSVPLAADSNSAIPTVSDMIRRPSKWPAEATIRASAASIRSLVKRSLPAT